MNISRNFIQNINHFNASITNCDDIKSRTMYLGQQANIKTCIYYVEVAINNITIEESVIGKLLSRLMDMDEEEMYSYLSDNALGIPYIYSSIFR